MFLLHPPEVRELALPDPGTLGQRYPHEVSGGQLQRLMAAPDDPVILRAGEGASVQALVDAMAALRGAGIGHLIVLGAE